uniref:Uncharacterized protein n=1 Tax=Romanomermis culicivorax TaxID=13658 RepID=A0A915LBI5_ROMCU
MKPDTGIDRISEDQQYAKWTSVHGATNYGSGLHRNQGSRFVMVIQKFLATSRTWFAYDRGKDWFDLAVHFKTGLPDRMTMP